MSEWVGGKKLNFYYFCEHKKFQVILFFERLVIKVKKGHELIYQGTNIERMSELCMRK